MGNQSEAAVGGRGVAIVGAGVGGTSSAIRLAEERFCHNLCRDGQRPVDAVD